MSVSRVGNTLMMALALTAATVLSCSTDRYKPDTVDVNEQTYVVDALNKAVVEFMALVREYEAGSTIVLFSNQSRPDGIEVYRFETEEGRILTFDSEIKTEHYPVPDLSVGEDGGRYYWLLDGEWITVGKKTRVEVSDIDRSPHFFISGSEIAYSLGPSSAHNIVKPTGRTDAQVVRYHFDEQNNRLVFKLSSRLLLGFLLHDKSSILRDDVQNTAFYKDVFLDAGIGLTSRKYLPVFPFLGLKYEYLSLSRSEPEAEEIDIQESVFAGRTDDSNGVLLYPDGQPRFRLLFVNGGNSSSHGQSLSEKSLDNMRLFVRNGGSYVGTCAGAFFASKGNGSNPDCPYYLSIWPGITNQTGIKSSYMGFFIEKDSPLLKYYGYGGDYYVNAIRHNGGGFAMDLPAGTEILARYDTLGYPLVHNQPSLWAYKQTASTGRVVLTGSHPEEVTSGEIRDLTASMVRYAMDGSGPVRLKSFLANGEPMIMNKRTEDDDPEHAAIGDLQVHHFAVYIPSEAENITFSVHSDIDCDMALMLSHYTYAFPETSDYRSRTPGAQHRMFFPTLEEGVWYVSVQCLTTVETESTDYGLSYSGRIDILNGVPYQITVSWE